MLTIVIVSISPSTLPCDGELRVSTGKEGFISLSASGPIAGGNALKTEEVATMDEVARL